MKLCRAFSSLICNSIYLLKDFSQKTIAYPPPMKKKWLFFWDITNIQKNIFLIYMCQYDITAVKCHQCILYHCSLWTEAELNPTNEKEQWSLRPDIHPSSPITNMVYSPFHNHKNGQHCSPPIPSTMHMQTPPVCGKSISEVLFSIIAP